MKRLLIFLLPLCAFAAAPANDWAPNATATIGWNSNISNGEAEWDRIGTLQVGADVVASSLYNVTRLDVAHATLHLAGDWFPRFTKLDRAAVGARVDWQHQFGDDALAPVFTVEAGGDAVATDETARRGTLGTIGLSLAKQFRASWRATLRERFDQYDAKRSVFDSHSHEMSVEISRDINDATRLSFSAKWREGDVVTYAQYHRPDLMAIAHDYAALSTFERRMTAYATNARTLSGRLALVHATSESTAIVLAYEYGRTTRTGLRFVNQLVSVSFVEQY